MNHSEYIELSDLQSVINDRIGSLQCWVRVEVESHRMVGGHHYLNVIEKKADGTIAAKASAKLWRHNSMVLARFNQVTGKDLEAGMSVVIAVSVEYHALYGLSLIILDIDTAYSLGLREQERQATIKRLTDGGLMDMQKQLPLPFLPGRIAVISSQSAAGYDDFVKHLNANSRGFVFQHTLFPSLVQGEGAPATIIEQLHQIEAAGGYDVVLILRGGGAESDMFCFDDHDLCQTIARCPLPVLTAIGHERDYHVADMVAHSHFKTPTALAGFLIDWMSRIEDEVVTALIGVQQALERKLLAEESRVADLYGNIRFYLSSNIHQLDQSVQQLQSSIANSMSAIVAKADSDVSRCLSTIAFAMTSTISACEAQIALTDTRITSSDPRGILRQGYALALNPDGTLVTSAQSKRVGEDFSLLFADGCWDCTINTIREHNLQHPIEQ
ncbi:MAG: exodeoxyribonuclease VII large subunit [Bacteroidales bacterium]|nr:exodeoxyribonuclease VII large subunit [Candidatus Colimorpha onthohippi]